MSFNHPVQCTRCRHKHSEAERVSKPRKASGGIGWSDSCCPSCGCKSYYDLTPQVAWCWASGLIEIGDQVPQDAPGGGGAIEIARGPKAFLKGRLEVTARHGYGASAGQLLVPGVPEAEGERAKGEALGAWLDWCRKGKKRRDGVVFSSMRDADEVVTDPALIRAAFAADQAAEGARHV